MVTRSGDQVHPGPHHLPHRGIRVGFPHLADQRRALAQQSADVPVIATGHVAELVRAVPDFYGEFVVRIGWLRHQTQRMAGLHRVDRRFHLVVGQARHSELVQQQFAGCGQGDGGPGEEAQQRQRRQPLEEQAASAGQGGLLTLCIPKL